VSPEVLEAGDLKASGVSLGAGGVITILAPLNSENIAEVDLDHAHNDTVAVTLNGSSTGFDASQIQAVVDFGGQGGHDLFVNNAARLGDHHCGLSCVRNHAR
jgi:hypothetical protein